LSKGAAKKLMIQCFPPFIRHKTQHKKARTCFIFKIVPGAEKDFVLSVALVVGHYAVQLLEYI
jgi:hypothetical protein